MWENYSSRSEARLWGDLPNYSIPRGENNKEGSGNHSSPFQLVCDWFKKKKNSGFGGLFRQGPSKFDCLAQWRQACFGCWDWGGKGRWKNILFLPGAILNHFVASYPPLWNYCRCSRALIPSAWPGGALTMIVHRIKARIAGKKAAPFLLGEGKGKGGRAQQDSAPLLCIPCCGEAGWRMRGEGFYFQEPGQP